MTDDAIPAEALRLWRTLAGDDDALRPGTRRVVRGSRGLCPPGWTGVVRLGDAVVVEAGTATPADLEVLLGLDDPTDLAAVRATLSPTDVLGPALLHHLPAGVALQPPGAARRTEIVRVAALADWLGLLDPGEVEESGVADMAAVVAVQDGDEVLGVAGHHTWPCRIAHMGVLVDPRVRGRGVGVAAAAAAVGRATAAGLVAQWRAHVDNGPSRGIARALGMRAVGGQLGLRLHT